MRKTAMTRVKYLKVLLQVASCQLTSFRDFYEHSYEDISLFFICFFFH